MGVFEINIFLIVMLTSMIGNSQVAFAQCPESPAAIDGKIDVSTEHDKKTGLYTYTYKVSNGPNGKLGIFLVNLEASEAPNAVLTPKKWVIDYETNTPATIDFFSSLNEIMPNSEPRVFKFTSKQAPGLVRYYMEGSPKEELKAEPVNNDPEAPPSCPGYYLDKPNLEQRVTGLTIGPVPANQIDVKVKMKVKKEKPEKGEDDESIEPEISSIAKGKIEVIVHGVKDFDLGATDLSSIRFGPAKVKPLSAKILGPSEQAYGWKNAPDEKSKRLWMVFNLADLQIRCDLDKALFFRAKAGGKELFGAASMKPVKCTKEIWSQMGF